MSTRNFNCPKFSLSVRTIRPQNRSKELYDAGSSTSDFEILLRESRDVGILMSQQQQLRTLMPTAIVSALAKATPTLALVYTCVNVANETQSLPLDSIDKTCRNSAGDCVGSFSKTVSCDGLFA